MKTIAMAVVVVLSTFAVSASSLSITAETDQISSLPGIPITLTLTVENTTDISQKLPGRMVLEVQPEHGQPFVPSVLGFPVAGLPDEYRDLQNLDPHEKRTFEIPLSAALMSGAMADPRLWSPGTYGLQLFFHDELRNEDVLRFGLRGLLGAGSISSEPMVSSRATIHIKQPAGIDAEIWNALISRTQGRGLLLTDDVEADRIAKELWPIAGDSAYMPYLITYMRYVPRKDFDPIWDRVIEHNPGHPVAEQARLLRATVKAQEAKSAIYSGGNLQEILAKTEEARAELAALQEGSQHDLLRIRARNALAKMGNREQIIQTYREVAPNR